MNERERSLQALTAQTVRFLAVDMIEQAQSGHPGLPMGAADYSVTLWTRFLRQDPTAPEWPDRDRFVLSAGHGSALLYALLHLSGYDLPMEELRRFRQWGSRTPGHPEREPRMGIETTTGPLGQGLAGAVGMAMAERHLAARFNRPGRVLVDHRTWVLVGDGDMMEGISSEAASLAGHLRLSRLNVLYDANRITIEGSTDLAFTEDVAARFRAFGWSTLEVDGYDQEQVAQAFGQARDDLDRPTLVVCRSVIGRGAPTKAGSESVHGAPLGAEELAGARAAAGWPAEPFHVPDGVREGIAASLEPNHRERLAWEERLAEFHRTQPELASEWDRRMAGALPADLPERLGSVELKDQASRKSSGAVLQIASEGLPELLGGSADLGPSNNTLIAGEADFAPPDYSGRTIRFGIREHAMAAAMNGLLAHGGVRGFAATFLVFSDYMRPAIRLAALMGLPAIYVFTHDSIHVGEDGPTHQPVEHVSALRGIPNLAVIRPADTAETVAAWRIALERTDGPTALVLTRQGLPTLGGEPEEVHRAILKGGRVLRDPAEPRAVLAATGSEVGLCLAAAELLAAEGTPVRVVSCPWLETLMQTPEPARAGLLPSGVPLLVVEAGTPCGWMRLFGYQDNLYGLERFGASAPGKVVAEKLGFSPAAVAERVRSLLRS